MKEQIGYEHTFQYYYNVNNVAKVKNYVAAGAAPQSMQANAQLDERYTHGIATIGPITRPMYFDLGGIFDLMDDAEYEQIVQLILAGELPGARIPTPTDLGYTERGVPIDLASASGDGSHRLRSSMWTGSSP